MVTAEEQLKEENGMWIKTEPVDGGRSYRVTMEADGYSLHLDEDMAMEFAKKTMWTIAYAEHDAAVYLQNMAILEKQDNVSREDMLHAVAHMVGDLRKQREPIDWSPFAPFSFQPMVRSDGFPMVALLINGEQSGVIDCEGSRSHALGTIESVFVAKLDEAYFNVLTTEINLEPKQALNAVAELGKYRVNNQTQTFDDDGNPYDKS